MATTVYPRRRRGRKTSKGKTTARKAIRAAKKANLKKFVMKVVSDMAETKEAYTTSGNSLIMFNSGIDSISDIQPIVPALGQGTDTNQRIGQTIMAQSLNIKGHVRLNFNDVADSTKLPNVMVRMMVLSMKNKPSYGDVTNSAVPLTSLLRKGGTTTNFTGVLSDLYAPINTDVFTVHHDKRYHLSQSYINGIGASIPSQYLAQDVTKTIRFFNLNVKCKNKKLKYDEDISSDSFPVNFSSFIVLGYAYLDGSAPDTLSTNVGLAYDSTLRFEDI